MSESSDLSLRQKLFLILCVPLACLLLLESACRLLSMEKRLAPGDSKMDFEMPAWMSLDQNQVIRVATGRGDRKSIDWLSLFEEGPGFRVRMIPETERTITNTFSQIKSEAANRYFVRSNSLGFRGPEIPGNKSEKDFLIMIFGDSSSFGWGVDQDKTFGYLLQKELNEKYPQRNFTVANFAIPGDSSEYGRLIFDSYIDRYNPDLVILGFGANDAKKSYISHTSQADRFRAGQTLQRIKFYLRYSALYRTLEALLKKTATDKARNNKPAKLISSVNKKRYAENLKYMAKRSVNKNSGNAMLINLCTPGNYSGSARKIAEKNGFLYLNGQKLLLDLIPEIQKGSVYPELVEKMKSSYQAELDQNRLFYVTSDSCHPNELGHRIIADKVTVLISGRFSF